MSDAKTKKPLKILVIGAHPADAFDNAGGTCLHHTQKGDTVVAAIMTGGARLHDVVIADGLRKEKQIPQGDKLKNLLKERSGVKIGEVHEACAIMGIHDVRFLGYDDSILLVKEQIIKDIAFLIRDVRPDILITHYPFDNGGYADQHAITGQCALHASWVSNTVDPEDPNLPHRVAQIFFMGFPSHFIKSSAMYREFSGHCQVYVDVSDVIDLKVKALGKLVSQQYGGDCAWKRVEAVEGGAGAAVKVAYAEPFIVAYADVHHTLPVSDFRLKVANEQEEKEHERLDFVVSKEGNLRKYQDKLDAKRRKND